MNRKIKFRGKRSINNDWVYGNYILIAGRQETFISESYSCTSSHAFEVKPESVGQFTGLHDENGTEIYEKDIVKLFYGDKYSIGIVLWNNKIAAWCIKLKGEHSFGSTPIGEMFTSYTSVVIGNIHDNPELIKEEQQ